MTTSGPTSGPATRITYIRHLQQTNHQLVDPPIRAAIRGLGNYDIIISSPYLRCRQTAECYGAITYIDTNISEYRGGADGKKSAGSLDSSTPYQDSIPDDTEIWEQCAARLENHLSQVLQLRGNILVVTHGVIVKYFQERLTGSTPYQRGRNVPYGGGFTVQW